MGCAYVLLEYLDLLKPHLLLFRLGFEMRCKHKYLPLRVLMQKLDKHELVVLLLLVVVCERRLDNAELLLFAGEQESLSGLLGRDFSCGIIESKIPHRLEAVAELLSVIDLLEADDARIVSFEGSFEPRKPLFQGDVGHFRAAHLVNYISTSIQYPSASMLKVRSENPETMLRGRT